MPMFIHVGKNPFSDYPRQITFCNTLFSMKKSTQYFESKCLKSYVIFSLMK